MTLHPFARKRGRKQRRRGSKSKFHRRHARGNGGLVSAVGNRPPFAKRHTLGRSPVANRDLPRAAIVFVRGTATIFPSVPWPCCRNAVGRAYRARR